MDMDVRVSFSSALQQLSSDKNYFPVHSKMGGALHAFALGVAISSGSSY